MDRPEKQRTPHLSLIVPPGPSSKRSSVAVRRFSQQTPALAPAKQKRLFPVACRLVSLDQWFTTRIDRTWNVLDLKIWLLAKALPAQILPLPASYRPSSPVTFAAAPPAPPRPSTASSYHAPHSPPAAIITPPTPQALPPSPTASALSFEHDDDDVPLYAAPYGDDASDEEDGVRIAPPAIPYSYSTGAPAISGLAALRSKAAARTYGSIGVPAVDGDLVRRAVAVAKRWQVYSFSAGMLLSDDLPLAEYSVRPYELLELHRAGAYVALPRVVLPALVPHSPSDTQPPPRPAPTKTARAYPTRRPEPTSESSDADVEAGAGADDEAEDGPAGSPCAQPYFDGWVWVLREGAAEVKPRPGEGGEEGTGARKMRRRGRAKSEAARAGKGKEKDRDRARVESEWMDVKRESDGERWKKRWLVVREGLMSVWRERRDEAPEECFALAACAALYGADKIPVVMAALAAASTSTKIAPFAPPLFADATSSAAASVSSHAASPHAHHVICARFRPSAAHRTTLADKDKDKAARKHGPRTSVWLALKLADESTHEHLLRIIHRLAYSAPIATTTPGPRPSTSSSAPAAALPTRTLRTAFLPNPIPHPLALSFSAPSPVAAGEGSDSPATPPASESEYDDPEWVAVGRKGKGKGGVRCVGLGLGRGIGVRFPEWREDVIYKAVHAGQGVPVDEAWGAGAPQPAEDVYGFGVGEVDGAYLDDADSEDADSDAFSEAEWEGWAYDLDRARVVDEGEGVGVGVGRRVRGGMMTPQGSPVSAVNEEAPLAVDVGVQVGVGAAPSEGASTPSTTTSANTLRPRARSVSDSPVQAHPALSGSPASLSPGAGATTPPTPRHRAATVSQAQATHARNALFAPRFDPDETTSVRTRTVEAGGAGGVRGLMRGLSMRAGKESFLRGLENALDFVEGK